MKLRKRKDAAPGTDEAVRAEMAEHLRVVNEVNAKRKAGTANTRDYARGTEAARAVREGQAELEALRVARADQAARSTSALRGRHPAGSLARSRFQAECAGTRLDFRSFDADDEREARRLLLIEGALSPADEEAAIRLTDRAAGEAGFIARRRRELAAEAKQKAEAERLVLAFLPQRRAPEPGSIELPRSVWQALTVAEDGVCDLVDAGLLVALAFAFANTSAELFARGSFDRYEDGTPTIAVTDAGHSVRLARGVYPEGVQGLNVRIHLRRLENLGWVKVEQASGTVRIRPGARMRDLWPSAA